MSKRDTEKGEVEKIDQNITTVRRSYSLVDGVSSQKRGATIIRVVLVVVVRRVSFQPLELTTPRTSDRRKWSKNKKTKKRKHTPVSVLFRNQQNPQLPLSCYYNINITFHCVWELLYIYVNCMNQSVNGLVSVSWLHNHVSESEPMIPSHTVLNNVILSILYGCRTWSFLWRKNKDWGSLRWGTIKTKFWKKIFGPERKWRIETNAYSGISNFAPLPNI